jgi:hypothetical protein
MACENLPAQIAEHSKKRGTKIQYRLSIQRSGLPDNHIGVQMAMFPGIVGTNYMKKVQKFPPNLLLAGI